jgi:hypothetical protein
MVSCRAHDPDDREVIGATHLIHEARVFHARYDVYIF